jgi:site-specific DNA recombinase
VASIARSHNGATPLPTPTASPVHASTSAITPRAVIYCRVSSDIQEDNYSLPTQEAGCRRYCEQHGYQIVAVFSDVHTGAQYRTRPGLSQLRELVRQRAVDVVVAYAVDRLSRNQAHIYILIEEFAEYGARLELVTEAFEDSAVGRFILAARSFAAEVEREKIIERTTRGTYARVRSGKPKPAARPPFGYRWRDEAKTAFAIDPDEAPVVRRIFAELANGASLRKVTMALNADGVPTPYRRARWDAKTINLIARNPAYRGEYYGLRTRSVRVAGRRKVHQLNPSDWVALPDVAPPIVAEDLWQLVQHRLDRNKQDSPRNLKYAPHALLRGGFARCGTCGRVMVVRTARSGVPRYACGGEPDHRCPAPATTTVKRLDSIVRTWIADVLSRPDVLVAAAEMMEQDPEQQQLEAEIEALERRAEELRRRRQNYLDAVGETTDPTVRQDLLDRAGDIGRQLNQVDDELARVRSARAGREYRRAALLAFAGQAAELARRFASLPLVLQRDALHTMGLAVRVYQAGRHGRRSPVEIELFAPVCVDDCTLAFQGNLHKVPLEDYVLIRQALQEAVAARA